MSKQINIEADLNRIAVEIHQEEQAKSLRSLSEDSSPESSPNWWISSDGEDILAGGTLDEVLQLTGIQQNQIEKTKKLCLQYGCIWFFPERQRRVAIEASPVKASQKNNQRSYNFLIVAHNPKLAEFYRA